LIQNTLGSVQISGTEITLPPPSGDTMRFHLSLGYWGDVSQEDCTKGYIRQSAILPGLVSNLQFARLWLFFLIWRIRPRVWVCCRPAWNRSWFRLLQSLLSHLLSKTIYCWSLRWWSWAIPPSYTSIVQFLRFLTFTRGIIVYAGLSISRTRCTQFELETLFLGNIGGRVDP
jgi:hypothetical protein